MKHIVCYSGGHSSALVAIEVFRRYGSRDLILLNHNINPTVEDSDIKRFKQSVAEYVGVDISYANMPGYDEKDQFDVVVEAGAFKVGNGTALCTNRLKTAPFMLWLKENFPSGGCVLYYGFDAKEQNRIQRRAQIMGVQGYATEFPLATWKRTIHSTKEIGIDPPMTYGVFNHANCVGCLKAGRQHWYVVYCTRPDIWTKGKAAEDDIGYTIIKGVSLLDLEPLFEKMRLAGVPATEKVAPSKFWSEAKKVVSSMDEDSPTLPCDCR
jgi:hypothetical protein